MQRFILRRIGFSILSLLVISVMVFFLARATGDPRSLMLNDDTAGPEQWEELGERLGLDKSLPEQYWIFMKGLPPYPNKVHMIHFETFWGWIPYPHPIHVHRPDLGDAINDHRPVTDIIIERIPATLQLGAFAFAFSVLLGVPLGILSAVKRNSMWDHFGKIVAMIGQSAPAFWLGIMMIFFFAVRLEWVPPSGRHDWNSFILPAVTLGWHFVAANLRLVRTSMLEVLDSEYIKMARAKGVSPTIVIWKHALRNALIAPITFMGVTMGLLITGSIVAETVFQWPGLGMLAFTSLQKSDYPMLQGIVLTFAVVYIGVNLLVDILYAYIDPRIRYG